MLDGKKTKLSEQTSDRLYEMIVDEQRYAPGSKLPNENELSRNLQVSRTTLRGGGAPGGGAGFDQPGGTAVPGAGQGPV